jgi:hypothetical protein
LIKLVEIIVAKGSTLSTLGFSYTNLKGLKGTLRKGNFDVPLANLRWYTW